MTDFNLNNKAINVFNDIDRFFGSLIEGVNPDKRSAILPVDVSFDKDLYTVKADLPGFSENEVSVEFDNGFIKILAESSVKETLDENGNDGENENRENADSDRSQKSRRSFNERVSYKKLERHVKLYKHVDEERISATLENGVLTVEAPIVPNPNSRKIEVTRRG